MRLLMYLFVADETNRTPSVRSRFFIYGGLLINDESLESLHQRIVDIRRNADLRSTDPLKFDTRSRPEGVSIQAYTEAKSAVIDACVEEGVQFAAYLVLHDIAHGRSDEDQLRFALNTLAYVFDSKFLVEKRDIGICVVDRFQGDYELLQEKFQRGVYVEDRHDWVRLPRVKMFAATCDGASHISSAVDIVLGAFRYCVNENQKTEVPKRLLPRVAAMMYHRKVGDVHYLRDYGLILRPRTVRVPLYRQEYERLVHRLGNLIGEAEREAAEDDSN